MPKFGFGGKGPKGSVEVDVPKIFANNQSAILDFFASGKPNVDRRESLTIMRLLDAARDARSLKGFVPLG